MRHFNENWDGIVRKNNGIMSFQERNRFVQTMESVAWLDESIHFTTEEILIFKEGNFEKLSKMPFKKIIEAVKRTAIWMAGKIDTLSGVPKILVHACRDYSSGKINFGKFKSILVSQCNMSSPALDRLKSKFEKVVAMGRVQMEKNSTFLLGLVLAAGGTAGLMYSIFSAAAAKSVAPVAQVVPELLARPEVAQAIEQATQQVSSGLIATMIISFIVLILGGIALGISDEDGEGPRLGYSGTTHQGYSGGTRQVSSPQMDVPMMMALGIHP